MHFPSVIFYFIIVFAGHFFDFFLSRFVLFKKINSIFNQYIKYFKLYLNSLINYYFTIFEEMRKNNHVNEINEQ